jgi:hypothetical protein
VNLWSALLLVDISYFGIALAKAVSARARTGPSSSDPFADFARCFALVCASVKVLQDRRSSASISATAFSVMAALMHSSTSQRSQTCRPLSFFRDA